MITLLSLLTLARADDEAAREDDLFGAPAAAPAPAPAAEPAPENANDRDSALLSGASVSPGEGGMFAQLLAADDRLAVGGNLYLRADMAAPVEPSLEDLTLSTPNLFDLYMDARPNDRVRGYVQGRLRFNPTVIDGSLNSFGQAQEAETVVLDQAWLKFDAGQKLFVTAGQQRIKWGSGRFWNPTDFLNGEALDPLAAFDERTGVSLVKLHLPVNTANFYVVGSFDEADHVDEIGGTARAEVPLGETELTATASLRKDRPLRLGADVSSGLGIFDVHVEGAVQKGITTPYYKGELDLASFTLPEATSVEEDWVPQVVAGAELTLRYSDQDTVSFGAEYFYNGLGYDEPDLYPWLSVGPTVDCYLAKVQAGDLEGADACVGSQPSAFRPFYLGRHYAAAYAYLADPGGWNDTTFTLSALANLSDGSAILRFDHRVSLLSYLSVNSYISGHLGEEGGEFRYAVDIPGVPGLTGFEEGFAVTAPLGEVGVGAQVRF